MGLGSSAFLLQFLEGAGQLVGAAGSTAVALDSFQSGYGILDIHACNEGSYSLQISVAAFGELYAPDCITLSFYTYTCRANQAAGVEDGMANAVLCLIVSILYVKHWGLFLGGQRYKNLPVDMLHRQI